jgi:hypothetical protein
MVACRSSKTEEGKKAAEAVVKQAASADLGVLAKALPWPVNVSEEPVHSVVPIIRKRWGDTRLEELNHAIDQLLR